MYCVQKTIFLFLLLALIFSGFADENSQQVLKKREPLTHEKSLTVFVKYGNGYINLKPATSKNAFEGEFVYWKNRPEVRYEIVGDEGRLNVYFSGKLRKEDDESRNIMSLSKLYDNELDLSLTPRVPVDLDLELGVIKGTLDFGGLRIKNLRMEVGVSTADMLFMEPNPVSLQSCTIEGGVGKLMIEKIGNANVEDFSFEGGVGSYVLDFSGEFKQNIGANIDLGMGKVKLYLPRYIGTRIKVDKSFLSSFSIDDIYKKNDYYYNENWEKTKYSLDLKIQTGVGKIEVIWVDK